MATVWKNENSACSASEASSANTIPLIPACHHDDPSAAGPLMARSTSLPVMYGNASDNRLEKSRATRAATNLTLYGNR